MCLGISTKQMNVIVAAKEASKSNKVILAHGENNIGLHGAGFAKFLTKEYPENGKKFENDCRKGYVKLGDVSWYQKDNLTIANCITQNGIRNRNNPVPFSYKAFRESMEKLKDKALTEEIRKIYMPKIGSGLAGGDWNRIYEIIEDVFLPVKEDIEVHIGYL